MAKEYPVVRKGRLAGTASTSGEVEINIEQFLSKTNRRMYRHARNYRVKIDLDADSPEKYRIFVLANNWMNHQALKMAYAMYLENSKDERDRLKDSALARWQDFRTDLGASGYVTGVPVQFTGNQIAEKFLAGEFEKTLVVDASGNQRVFSWNPSSSNTRYSILEEYDKAGNTNTRPTTSTGDMPYDDLMADDDANMADFLQTRGELPPYNADGVGASAPWVEVAELSAATTAQKLSTGFFDAPCGFVLIVPQFATSDELDTLSWSVQSGDYKGVHAPSMLE